MGTIITDILIIIMLWLMSNAVCVLVGFFVARKGQLLTQSKNATERKIEPISKEEQLKRDRELQEYINMMTYDGTEQEPIDAIKR